MCTGAIAMHFGTPNTELRQTPKMPFVVDAVDLHAGVVDVDDAVDLDAGAVDCRCRRRPRCRSRRL